MDSTDVNQTHSIFEWTRLWAFEQGLKLWASLETGSTNSIAKDDEDGATRPRLTPPGLVSRPSVYLALRQNAGRGRGSHTWTTPDGASLLSSWSFAMARVPQPIFSAIVGLTLFESARAIWPGAEFNLKAPNDLFIGRRKTAGILIETIDQGVEKRTVIGVGMNVFEAPEGLETATSLAEHLGRAPSREEWRAFLDTWLTGLTTAAIAGQESRLTTETAERLKNALNLHPLLKEPILRVDELGQLHSATRILHWHEL